MARCSSCGAEIGFITTPQGKKMPVDAGEFPFIPDRNGKVLAVLNDGSVLTGRTCSESYEAEAYCYARLSHFATCPKADEHRKPRD